MEKYSIVLQSNEVGGSYHMENEGLSRVLENSCGDAGY